MNCYYPEEFEDLANQDYSKDVALGQFIIWIGAENAGLGDTNWNVGKYTTRTLEPPAVTFGAHGVQAIGPTLGDAETGEELKFSLIWLKNIEAFILSVILIILAKLRCFKDSTSSNYTRLG